MGTMSVTKAIYTLRLNQTGPTLSCLSFLDVVKRADIDLAVDKPAPVRFCDKVHRRISSMLYRELSTVWPHLSDERSHDPLHSTGVLS